MLATRPSVTLKLHTSLGYGLAVSLVLAGCTGLIGDGESPTGDDGTTGDDTAALCAEAEPDVGLAPLRRLTNLEYINSVRDLLELEAAAAEEFVPDEIVAGFAANSVAPLSELQVEQYVLAAEELGVAAHATHGDTWFADCSVADTDCVEPVLSRIAEKAFRRPFAGGVRDAVIGMYESARDQWGAARGVEMAIATILSSPYFLYHLEIEPSGDEVRALVGFELASRLSFFLWQSVPDDALISAAQAGVLETPEGVEAEVRRMLASGKAQATIESFHGQWLELDHLDQLVKDPDVFPQYGEALASSMKQETLAFVSHIVNEGKPASELFSADYSFVDQNLAELYGVSVDGEGMVEVKMDQSERAGILTQASFLATRAHAVDTSWVHRGKFVREKLLCQPLTPPPPGVDQATANDPDRLQNPECASCHEMMDPIGLGFEKYDALGQYREQYDDGSAIDDRGEVIDRTDTFDIGAFDGAIELAGKLSEDDAVMHCLTTQWFRYATRRAESDEDVCSIEAAHSQFAESGYDIRELLVAIAVSDAFRHRRDQEGTK